MNSIINGAVSMLVTANAPIDRCGVRQSACVGRLVGPRISNACKAASTISPEQKVAWNLLPNSLEEASILWRNVGSNR